MSESLTYANVVSSIALFVSLGSLGVAAYNAFRDRARLKVVSSLYEGSDGDRDEAHISVQVVNKGRRPVILRMIGGYDKAGDWSATFIEREKGGLRLGEHEHHEFTVKKLDAVSYGPDGPQEPYERMWIEDSLGHRHAIPDSREYVRKLFS